jgi:hypothetical protein
MIVLQNIKHKNAFRHDLNISSCWKAAVPFPTYVFKYRCVIGGIFMSEGAFGFSNLRFKSLNLLLQCFLRREHFVRVRSLRRVLHRFLLYPLM